MSDVFISYKTEDRARIASLVGALEGAGLSVWWDQHIEAGSAWRVAITDRLDQARCVLVIWSVQSVGAGGRFVQDEAARAERRGTYLPVLLDAVEPPLGFGQVQALSLVGWRGNVNTPAAQAVVTAACAIVAGERPLTAKPMPVLPARPIPRRALLAGAGVIAAGGIVAVTVRPIRCAIGLCSVKPPSSIAVLPFRNLGGDSAQDYFSDGIAEELRGALARLGSIRVAGRISSDAFRGSTEPPAAIADKLGVTYILDGSVRRAGEMVRVGAALVEAQTGFERWAQSYDRELKDIFAVQSGIAAAVAEELRGKLLGTEAAAIASAPTTNANAYDAYLRGRQLIDLTSGEDTYRAALALFDQAVAADPGYAAAYAGRARALAALANQFEPTARIRATYALARAAAERAVALAPGLAEAQSTLGYVRVSQNDFAGARAPYERSAALGPNNADVLIRFGVYECRMGRFAAGQSAVAHAVELDPLNPRAHKAQASAFYAARRYPETIAAAQRALKLSPKGNAVHSVVGDALLGLGRTEEAIAEYRAEPLDFTRLTGLAIALKRAGDTSGAQSAWQQLVAARGDSAAYQQAEVLAQWGDIGGAVRRLQRAAASGDNGLIYILNDPFLDPLRRDPAFRSLLQSLRLTA